MSGDCFRTLWMDSRLSQQSVVFLVRADPEPDDVVVFHNAESAVCSADAYRVNSVPAPDAFEVQAWMAGVGSEQDVGVSRLALDVCR